MIEFSPELFNLGFDLLAILKQFLLCLRPAPAPLLLGHDARLLVDLRPVGVLLCLDRVSLLLQHLDLLHDLLLPSHALLVQSLPVV